MIVNFVYNDNLKSIILPEKISGQFWLTDSNKKNVIRIEAINGKWVLKTVSKYQIKAYDSTKGDTVYVNMIELLSKGLYQIISSSEKTNDVIYIFTEEYTNNRIEYALFQVPSYCTLTIGNGKVTKNITYENDYVSSNQATLQYSQGEWSIVDDKSRNGTFVNGKKIESSTLKYGDMIFVMGMKIIVGLGCFSINNPDGKVKLYSNDIILFKPPQMSAVVDEDDENSEEEVYFDRSPRFKRNIEALDMPIDSPPHESNQEEMPVILTVGPAMTMAMASMTTGTFAITNAIASGNVKSAIPTVVMSFSMVLGTLMWPTLTRKYTKKQKETKENLRRAKYFEYLEMKRLDIRNVIAEQEKILRENNATIQECENRILSIQRNLWERSIGQDDFLTLRLGVGNLPVFGNLQYSSRRFSLSDDILEDEMLKLCEEPKVLTNVPITLSLFDESIGIIGDKLNLISFTKGIIIQLCTLYSYDEVKLVVLYDQEDEEEFKFVKWLPHVWNNEKTLRLIAVSAEEVKSVSAHLERVFGYREGMNDVELADEYPYYVVITLSKKQFNRAEVLKNILASKKKVHISVVSVFTELRMLPKECTKIVELNGNTGKLYDRNDTSGKVISFNSDISLNHSALELSTCLANIQLDDSDQSAKLPKMITFLQMMNVGKVEHLNSLMRWKENDPTKSLAVPVGVNPYGDLFVLDLHEKFHGPHGLVAGMTGSGKSEFIITYILSLAVNFHPDEVSFIMIDYKGGGMAKSFESLPHTAGIITNLDGSAMKRSLVSINSELKRRQSILTSASKIVGESNLNIYQYQKLYREKVVIEPLSHLFIIADEFAELKTQQPEFMTELISAARIGRSLGVHLILATQKPSGVVDDQIWSNSRFRVCLKVQERQDSMDMLKRPDAAELADTGRFYLQVGYNELFELGQSSWAGADYIPSDHVIIEKDNGVEALDLNGHIIRAVKPQSARSSMGKQLDKITSYLQKIAVEDNIKARPLWLDPIPEIIVLSELIKKYPEKYQDCNRKFWFNPVIGEYDDPATQTQGLLSLPISEDGNAIIYGAAGSGKTILLNTLIYSLITEHTPDEINLYMLDFADETLNAFSRAPHVGEVMLSNDSEKITRLFKSMYYQLKKRKKKLSMLGLDYISYTHQYGDSADMPAIVIVIHNFTAFAELYSENEDDIIYLSREGSKYGVYFILTAQATNGIRLRITQNFKQHLVLQQNDDSDYSAILGKTDGLFPAKLKGRGLVKTEKLVEFQSAHISKEKSTFDAVKAQCEILRAAWGGNTAEKIPVLPDVVDAEFLFSHISEQELLNLPIGVDKNTLKVYKYNFGLNCINLLLSMGNEYFAFLSEFLNLLFRVQGLNVVIFDPEEKLMLDNSLKMKQGFSLYKGIKECNDGIGWLFNEVVKRNNNYKDALSANTAIPEFEYTMCLFVSMKSLISILDEDRPERLRLVLENNDIPYRFSMIITDENKNVASYSFNSWFKKHISGNDGLWYGSGVTEQYNIRANETNSAMRQPISVPLGYAFEKGEATLCKLMSESGDIDGN